jgi:murein DD-endopeptidase MepM/ murein hydrolase activator NlpD
MKKKVFILSISLLFGTAFSQECKYHKVKSGESLEKIARNYGVSVQELIKANKNINPNRLKVGENLCIPQKTPTKARDYAIYKVKKVDTLQSIAEKFGVDVQELKSFNNLKSDKIIEGQEIKIPAKGTAKKQKKETQEYGTYVVQKGARLEHIAKKLGVSQRELEELNPELKGKWLKKGTVVKVPVKIEEKKQAVRLAEKPLEERKKESTPNAEAEMLQEKKREAVEVKLSKDSLPMPVDGKISKSGRGITVATDCGKSVRAVDNGRVIYSGGDLKAYGNMVIVDHGDFISIYAYNEKNLVKRGDSVSRGQQIALVGRKSEEEECMLYFELRNKEGVPLDPTEYIRNTQ